MNAESVRTSAPLSISGSSGDLRRSSLLFGSTAVAPTRDTARAGSAQAFAFLNRTAGTAHAIVVYLDHRSRARRLMVGLYAGSRHPGHRVTLGVLGGRPRAGTWNVIPVATAFVSANTRYWIAVLGQAGTLDLREITGHGCKGQRSYARALPGMPATWRGGRLRSGCRLSAYVVGTRSPLPPTNLLYGSQRGPYSSVANVWPGEGWQPYAVASWANSPLPAWQTARLYSRSVDVMSYMSANWAAGWTPWTFSNSVANDESSAWGHPLYFARSSDPLYTINSQNCTVGYGLATFCPRMLRIPSGAMHASGSDGHLEVVEPAGFYSSGGTDDHRRPPGEVDEVDFYSVTNPNPLAGGGTISSSFDGALNFDGSGCCGYSTAMNQGLAGLMIRAQDLQRGVIDHALGGSFKCSNGTNVTPWPLVGGGGACPSGGQGPPIGGRLQLKMDDSTIDALSIPGWQKTIYMALAHYGLYVTDTGGAPMDPEFEPAADYLSFGNTSHTLMTFFASAAGGAKHDPYTYTLGLPWSDFQIVDPCYARRAC